MTKLNEFQIIKIFQNSFGRKSKFLPEDVEIFRLDKTLFVIKSDMLVESTDVPPGMNEGEIARKSLVSCVSDFASKGVRPRYATLALSIPSRFSESKIRKLAFGFRKASKEFGFKIIGGDVNEGKELVISTSLIGLANKIVPRNGAKINDIIITSGPFGYSSAGLHILLHGARDSSKNTRKFKKMVFTPNPKLRFGIAIGPYLSSAMDSSDGLSSTTNDMSKQSKKKFIITNLPTDTNIIKFSAKNKINLVDLVFNGGEEFEIVATVPPRNLVRVKRIAKMNKIKLFKIGRVTKGSGVYLQYQRKTVKIQNKGWVHFRS